MRQRYWIPMIVVPGLLLSCGGAQRMENKGQVSVAYSTEAVTLAPETVGRDLLFVSDRGEEWVFDERASETPAMTPGKILVVPGIALRRVTRREQSGGRVYLLTEQATLTEAFRDARLEWTTPVRFGKAAPAAGSAVPGLDWLRHQVAYAAYDIEPVIQTYTTSGEIEGWKYTASAVTGGDKADLFLEVKRQIKGFDISLTGKGHIKDFETYATLMIHDSKLKYFNFKNPRLNGEMHYELAWEKKPKAIDPDNAEIKLPAVGKLPFLVGPIPLQIELSAAILITPGMGAQGSGRYKFQAKYDGYQGFKLEGENFLTEAQMQAKGLVEETFSASLAGHAFLVGVSAPRIELKLGLGSVLDTVKNLFPNSVVKGIAEMLENNPFEKYLPKPIQDKLPNKLKTEGAASVQIVTLATYLSSGPLSLIPCRKMQVIVLCKVGAKASVLGQNLPEQSVEVFRNEHVETWPENVKCAE